MSQPLPFAFDSLPEIWQGCWERLGQAVVTLDDPWRTPALATVADDRPELRTVVLRRVDPLTQELWFYTDLRSPKVAQLSATPQAAWLFYDPQLKVQLRIHSRVEFERDPAILTAAWGQLREQAQREYLSPRVPGSLLDAELHEQNTEPSITKPHFAVIRCHATELDALQLRPTTHLRAHFRIMESGYEGVWLVP